MEFYPQNLYSFYGQTNLSLSGSLAIDLVGGKSVDTLNGYPIFSPYAAHTRTLVDIHGSFKAFSTRRRPCTTVNQWDCRNRCRGEFIYQKCGCWPLIFAGLLSDKKLAKVRFCGDNASAQTVAPPYQIPDLGLCLIEKAIWMTDPAYECQKGCQPDCDHLKLSFTSEIHSGVRCHNCTTQTVQISSFSYPHIEEVMAKSLESLVAEFGGLVGLWMGGSVIAFSHVVIFALKVSQNLCSNGTKRKMGAAQDTIL